MAWCCSLTWLGIGFAVLSLLTYLVPYILDNFVFSEQNLKRKYGSQWAVVTGSSSGIGLSIARKLAKQEINVVVVALDDDVLTKAVDSLKAESVSRLAVVVSLFLIVLCPAKVPSCSVPPCWMQPWSG